MVVTIGDGDGGAGLWGATGGVQPVASPPSAPQVVSQGGYDWVLDFDDFGDQYWRSLGRTTSGGSASGPDRFFDISPTNQYGMDADRRDFDYGVGRDAIGDARDQRDFDYGAARDAADDAARSKNLGMQDQWNQTGFAIDRERIAAQAQADAARTSAQLAGVAQQGEAARLQYQVGMAGAANDAERNKIQAAWNSTQAALAREEYALRDRLTTQQNQIAQYSEETKRAGTLGQLALDNNKFILEKSTSPRDLFGLFMMQRGINPDWDRMAAGQDPGQIAPLVPQPLGGTPGGFQFSTPTVQFGQQAAPAQGGGGGGAPQPQPQQSYTPPGLQFQPSPPPANTFGPTPPPPPPPPMAQPQIATSWMDNGGYEPAGRDYVRDPVVNPSDPEYGGPRGPLQSRIDVDYGDPSGMSRYPTGGYTTEPVFMAGDSPRPNPSSGGARPEVIFNPTRAPLSVAPNPQTKQELGYSIPSTMASMAPRPQQPRPQFNRMTRPVGQMYDFMNTQDRQRGGAPAMGAAYYKQRMMADYGQRGWTEPALYRRPMKRFAIGTQAAYEAGGMGSQYLPSSQNPGVDRAGLPPRLKMLADAGMPLSPSLIAGATGGRAPTLNLGGAVTAGRGAGVLPSLQTLGRQSKSETEQSRGYFEGVGGVPWADIVDFLGKTTSSLKSAATSRAY